MQISIDKTIRPTQLQPKIYSIVNYLSEHEDYKVVVDKDNKPLCVMVSYGIFKKLDFYDYEQSKKNDLVKEMKSYYSSIDEDEKELLDSALLDGYEV